MGNRINYIDNIKGVGIFLVILGHTITNDKLVLIIYSFHIPLFFFISGLLNRVEKETFSRHIINKFQALIIPYFVVALFSFFLWFVSKRMLLKETVSLYENLLGIVRANINFGDLKFNIPLWFLPCLFIIEFFHSSIVSLFQRVRIVQYIAIVSISTAGFIIAYKDKIHLPWMTEVAMCQFIFFYMGYLIRNKYNEINKFLDRLNPCFIISIYVIVVIIYWHLLLVNGRVDTSSSIYGNPILFIVNAVIGILLLYVVIYKFINRYVIVITFTGQSSLLVFSIHSIPLIFINYLIGDGMGGIIIQIISSFLVLFVALIFQRIITKSCALIKIGGK